MSDALTARTPKPGTFQKGYDPRRVARATGVLNKKTRIAQELLHDEAERMVRDLLELTKVMREDPEKCLMCGRGMMRDEELRLKALQVALDRAGVTSKVQVEHSAAPVDNEWLHYATDDEFQTLVQIQQRCKGRMPANVDMDVQAEPAGLLEASS